MLMDTSELRNIAQKNPVRAVTTVALAAGGPGVYAAGTLGFNATLTATANSIIDVIDGVTLVVGDRVLINAEVAPANNGIYVLTVLGTAGVKWVLTRAPDSDTAIKTYGGIGVMTTGDGTLLKNRGYILSTTGALVIGTTAQTWVSEIDATLTVPKNANKNMAASATTADNQIGTATTMTATPAAGGYVQVMVNGRQQPVGDAVKTKESYFSSDGGTTAKAINAILTGDSWYWNGSVAGFNLQTYFIIDFNYVV